MIESIIPNARHTTRNRDRGKEKATIESIISNTRYTIRDSDGYEGGAPGESTRYNARHAVRNNCVLTTDNKGVSSRFDNCVAVIATIIGGITFFNYNGSKGGTTMESTDSNSRYTLRDGD